MEDIRAFRKNLRKFEQFLGNQLLDCCCGITVAQCHCLLAIEELGQTTLGNLAKYLNLDKSTLSRTVEGLVRLGLVDRKTGLNDRRCIRILLTASGRHQAENIHSVNDDYFLRVFDFVPRGDRGKVVKYLGLFVEAISQYEDERETNEECCEGQTVQSGI